MNSRKLTDTGIEVIYERIPDELREIQEKVEEYILECTEKTGSDILANHYLDTMAWYFVKPRFYWSTLLGNLTPMGVGNVRVWLRSKGASVKRYLSTEELEYFNQNPFVPKVNPDGDVGCHMVGLSSLNSPKSLAA